MKKIFQNNKKIIINTLFDIIVLSIVFIICMLLIHIGLKTLLNINPNNITELGKALVYVKSNALYLSIMFICMYIFSFIIFSLTTIDQVRDKTINHKNYSLYLAFMISFILFVNTLLCFSGGVVINNRLSVLCKACATNDMSYYTYQLQYFISVIKLLCLSYVIWSIISIIVVAVILHKYRYNNSIITKIKKIIKKCTIRVK